MVGFRTRTSLYSLCTQTSPGACRVSIRTIPQLLAIALAAIVVTSPGCATVSPAERERLADPIMVFDENPIEKGHLEHHRDYREGSVGGTGTRGGGCGCG